MRNRHLYPANWESEIRPTILVRDKFKCTTCLVPQGARVYYVRAQWFLLESSADVQWAKDNGYKVVKIGLQIAHLDQDVNNNDPSNLQAKCPKCHLSYDAQFNRAKRMQRPKSS